MTATPLVGSSFFGIDISQLSEQLSSMRRRVSKRVLVLAFSTDLLHLAEACLTQQGVQLNHISSVALPPEALDRGVPAEPAKMASLIQQICTEKKIPAHRVAVVLPPEVAFQRLVDLPGELTTEQAREFVLDPSKGVQLPFPLAQTDFDLVPMSTPSIAQRAAGMRLYMLSAVPQVLVDQVIEMLQAADLELQLLELGSLSQLRPLALDLVMLAPHQVELVLELRPDCSHLMLVTCSGLLGSERLAAIRDFPEPELDEEQTTAALEAGLSAESFTVQDESYLPISELDLRVLIADLKAALARLNAMFPDAVIRCLQLTGINSAHPMLVDLLQQALGLKVLAHRPLLAPGIAGFTADEVLVQTALGPLVGLALGLLNRDQLVACPVDGFQEGASRPHRPGVAIQEFLDLDARSSSFDQPPVSSSSSAAALVEESVLEGAAVVPLAASALDTPTMPIASPQDDEDQAVFAEVLDQLDEPYRSTISAGVDEVVEEKEGEGLDAVDEEWPSVASAVDKVVKEETKDGLSAEVEEWPSINRGSDGAVAAEELKNDVSEEEVPWPTIAAMASVDEEELSEGHMESFSVAEKQREPVQKEPALDSADDDSLLMIPGLDVGSGTADDRSRGGKAPVVEQPDDADLESLGELRFADPD
jgi:hypothetical protein